MSLSIIGSIGGEGQPLGIHTYTLAVLHTPIESLIRDILQGKHVELDATAWMNVE
jgi:hypothetical protein